MFCNSLWFLLSLAIKYTKRLCAVVHTVANNSFFMITTLFEQRLLKFHLQQNVTAYQACENDNQKSRSRKSLSDKSQLKKILKR